jgi:MscS family membrane protein
MKHGLMTFWLLTLLAVSNLLVAEESVPNNVVPETVNSAQQTRDTFIESMYAVVRGDANAMAQARSTLDLSDVATVIRTERGNELAYSLYSILQHDELVQSELTITGRTALLKRYPQGSVEIVRMDDDRWLFSKKTLAAVPSILDAKLSSSTTSGSLDVYKSLPLNITLKSMMPEALKQGFILEYWQWIGIFLAILIGSISDKLLAWMLAKNVARWKRKHPEYEALDETILRPLGLMAMALMWWFGLGALGLPDGALVVLSVAVKMLVSISTVWSAFRLVDMVYVLMLSRAMRTENKFDDLLVPMVSKSLKVFVVVVGAIFTADNLNIDVTSLLAGLGLGGLAFALAAKDLLGNFFGSLTVLLDRPFHIGDWVIIGDVEGSVEEVGFRSTRIRTFYNSLVTLPNSNLTTTTIDNMGARRYRRMKAMLGLTYQTPPEKIDAFCEGIRELVRLHPYMRKDFYHVYFNEYNSASLDILVYVFWETPDWNTELRERHRFLLDILRLAKQVDVDFAYPTQTLYLKRDESLPGPASAFKTAMSQDESHAFGQQQAEAIVEGTLGKGVKPEPVKF